MPWCPKCKSEYRDGFSVCSDCGSVLVDEEQFKKLTAQRQDLARQCQREENVQQPEQYEQETAVSRPGQPMSAQTIPGQSMSVQAEVLSAENVRLEPYDGDISKSETAGEEDSFREADYFNRKAPRGSIYQDSSEKASENRSSAWVLLIIGSLGILVILLGLFNVIPLKFSNAYLGYGVMAAIFILFWVSGVVSMKNARIFKKKAESENSLRDTMLEWCRENLHGEELDRQIRAEGNLPETEEIWYFRRFDCIKDKLNYQFVNLDQDFLDRFIDDYVYELVFGDEKTDRE